MTVLFKTGACSPCNVVRETAEASMFRHLVYTLAGIFIFLSAAQAADAPDKAAHQAAMQKFAFLVGEWEGSGSIAMGPGPRQPFTQTERIQFRHDGTLLMIEGHGKHASTGASVHDALAIVTYDAPKGKYRFRSFAAVGRYAEAEAIVDGNRMTWWMKPGPVTVRYTIVVDNGIWKEIGESSPDGKTWTPFFEMTLRKKA